MESMKTQALITMTLLAAALPALAVPSCPAPQVPLDVNCTLTTTLGWAIAGQGTSTIITAYLPPSASGPVFLNLKGLYSNLGNSYTGFLGLATNTPGQAGVNVLTVDNSIPVTLLPGQMYQTQVTQICWDPTCKAPAPAGAVGNMVSVQEILSSTVPADINLASVQLTAQFVSGNQVTFQQTEMSQQPGPNVSYIPGVNIGSTPAGRYVYNGSAVTQPYVVLSVTNASSSPISGTVTLVDRKGNFVGTANVPTIPVNGAVGYLVVSRNLDDPLGLLNAGIVLPAGSDSIFHGTLIVNMSGPNVTLSQEFNGSSMLNLPVMH
jgi:hypothetical protein